MELAPNPHYSGGLEVVKALGGSFKLVMLAPKTVREMTQHKQCGIRDQITGIPSVSSPSS